MLLLWLLGLLGRMGLLTLRTRHCSCKVHITQSNVVLERQQACRALGCRFALLAWGEHVGLCQPGRGTLCDAASNLLDSNLLHGHSCHASRDGRTCRILDHGTSILAVSAAEGR